jgi:hypothetical protein
MNNRALLEEFSAFVAGMERHEERYPIRGQEDLVSVNFEIPGSPWWYHGHPGFNDFNKEICPPGVLHSLPDGAVGIRSDGDFWTEAIFPWRFRELLIQEMVAVLWPQIGDASFKQDTTSVSDISK